MASLIAKEVACEGFSQASGKFVIAWDACDELGNRTQNSAEIGFNNNDAQYEAALKDAIVSMWQQLFSRTINSSEIRLR